MLIYPDLNPILFSLGPINIYWYGVMYLIGFVGAFAFCVRRRRCSMVALSISEILDLFFYAAIGVILGGAIGFWLFYEPAQWFSDPWRVLRFWERGRSFHGGLLGVLVAILYFCKVYHRRFLEVSDFIAPAVPIGLAAGRIGNFINGELWGRVTDMPIGMIFSHVDLKPRHPSQLYEFLLEGLLLFIILAWYARKPRRLGSVSGWFLILYGLFRMFIEFFREPDDLASSLVFDWVTRGQLLSFPMLIAGVLLLFYARGINRHANIQ